MVQTFFGNSPGPTLSKIVVNKIYHGTLSKGPIDYNQFKSDFKFFFFFFFFLFFFWYISPCTFFLRKLPITHLFSIKNQKWKKWNGWYDHWTHFEVKIKFLGIFGPTGSITHFTKFALTRKPSFSHNKLMSFWRITFNFNPLNGII